MSKRYRYKPEAVAFSTGKYSGFGGGISFGDKSLAKAFVENKKQTGIYTRFRIVKQEM